MSRPVLPPTALRLAAFAALAGFTAAQWATLLVGSPTARALLAALAATCGAAAIAWVASRPGRERWTVAAGLGIALAAAAVAALAVGLPARLLAPGGWDELAGNVGGGISRLGGVDYPYTGGDEWARLAVMLALPVLLAAAALLAFWPGRGRRGARLAALVLVLGGYGYAATLSPPGDPLLRGLVLLSLVAAWLWLPRLRRGDRLAAAGILIAAGLAALPIASRLDAREPLIDWSAWDWGGDAASGAEFFVWDHSYGPIEWSRTGRKLLQVQSAQPHYWRTVVLDRFDGVTWSSSQESTGAALDLPTGAEPRRVRKLDPRWIHTIRVGVSDMNSPYLIGAGSILGVAGVTGAVKTDNGVSLPASGALAPGDTYRARVYTPDPSAAAMRASDGRYPPALSRYTTIGVPAHGTTVAQGGGLPTPDSPPGHPGLSVDTIERLTVPLRRPGSGPVPFVTRRLADSPYAGVYRIARRVAGSAPTAYDAALAVDRYLGRGFLYDERPPQRRYPLRAFLMRDRIGYCQQFSGAMALMLRMVGVPARVAEGFSPGTRHRDRFTVTDLDAHSWVEVYFRGIGWVPFDPTPSAAPASSRPVALGIAAAALPEHSGTNAPIRSVPQSRRGKGIGTAPRRRSAHGGGGVPQMLVWAGILAAVAAAALAGLWAARSRRTRRLPREELAEALARELAQGLGMLRRRPPRGETLLTIEKGMRTLSGERVAAYAAALRSSRFAPGAPPAPSPEERRMMRRALSAGHGLRGRIRALVAFPPGGPALQAPRSGAD
jgi:protein-glutamine gamma-glutamyltransferase